ncbi:MAG: arginine deiminase family protein [candidate division Zixibacteria bacterium]|nr:arginine deiminase family protein [candidate division Zixibacteria bacterium]
MKYGGHSEVGKIESLLIKHPDNAFISQNNIDAQWNELNYYDCPNFNRAIKEYEQFINLLKEDIPEIHYLPKADNVGIDSIYTRDPLIITNKGIILCNMGKKDRQEEPSASGSLLSELGIPILGRITGDGKLEGGDLIWMDDKTLVVGRGYRTNDEGIRQLKLLTEDIVEEFVVVPLAHWLGPSDVMHLMSFISPIDSDLALVYSRIMPVPFREWLLYRGVKLIEVPDSEYESMACNVLTIAPRKCIMLSGNSYTKRLLKNEGVEVREYLGDEISKKGAGGPTCLTKPILRLQ